ncbi:winged helix-turn-helix domain-containing protein [Sulfobacillus sp. hq2]|uniref:winged helix-turn-helix domain-containing protein n=2 Tax=Sulfobacillus TaxID=28033 RepID=UPI000CD0A329|nr:winged helix-turn-helix domain-containing protein [Sulfobacillus sp. hq2]POB10194.1 hypothetical protein CO251_11100 [Sulfobacillus sp. hq2]
MIRGLQLRERIIVDPQQQGIWRAHHFVPLPIRTYRILACCLDHPHQILPDSLLLRVGWPEDIRTPADLFPQIHRIRQAIESDPRHPRLLVTRREAGYLLQVTPVVVEFDPLPPSAWSS